MSNQNTIIIRAHRQDDQIQLSDQTANIVLLVDVRRLEQLSIKVIEKRLEDLLPRIHNRITVYIYWQDAFKRTMEGPHDIVARHFSLMPKLQEVCLQNVGDYEGFLSDLAKLPSSVESLQMEISRIGPDDELRHDASGVAPLKIKHLVLSASADIDDDDGRPKGFELPWNFDPSLESLHMDDTVAIKLAAKLPDIQRLQTLSFPVHINTIPETPKLLVYTGKSLTRLRLILKIYNKDGDLQNDEQSDEMVEELQPLLNGDEQMLPNLLVLHTSAPLVRILMKNAPKVTSLQIEDQTESHEARVKISAAIKSSLTGRTLESFNVTYNGWSVPAYLPLLRHASRSVSIRVRERTLEGQQNKTLADHVLSAEGPLFSSTVKYLTLIDPRVEYNPTVSFDTFAITAEQFRDAILTKYGACLDNCDVEIRDAKLQYIFEKDSIDAKVRKLPTPGVRATFPQA